jgi:acyl-CoA synthetase (AMP-forming)/AMP-acid ligase II
LKPGDRVAVLARPCHWFAVVEVGTVVAGGILVPVFPRFGPSYVNQIIAEVDPTILCYSQELAPIAEGLDTPSLRARLSFDPGGPDPSIDQLIGETDPVERVHEGALADVALIIYTSGTAGHPKGVTHTHQNWSAAMWGTPQQHQGWVPEGCLAVSWNIYHASGQGDLWRTFFQGWRVAIAPPLAPVELVDFLGREAMTHVSLVGANFKDVVDALMQAGRILPHARHVRHAGAPTTTDTLRQARAVFPRAHILEAYAMTESMYISALDVIQSALAVDRLDRLLSVGMPIGQVELRLVDDDARDVRAGAVGEIVIRGDSLSPGYWKSSEGAAGSFVDGWFRTGDLGRLDQDGYLYIVDRKKDMVIVGASNVYTAEVENVLSQHPLVRECAVIGVPRPGEGEEVLAVIVPQAGATIGLGDLRRFVGERLAEYKVPTRLDLRSQLPRTGVGKTDKKVLRQEYWGDRARQVN